MLKGRYRRHSVNLMPYRVSRFIPHLYLDAGECGCGATAVSLITGDNPFSLNRLNKGKRHFPDKWVVTQLQNRFYTAIPLKWRELNSDGFVAYPIDNRNVVLISQMMFKREASWMVLHNGLVWHNFEPSRIHPYDFLNKPVLTAYVLWHSSWSDRYV